MTLQMTLQMQGHPASHSSRPNAAAQPPLAPQRSFVTTAYRGSHRFIGVLALMLLAIVGAKSATAQSVTLTASTPAYAGEKINLNAQLSFPSSRTGTASFYVGSQLVNTSSWMATVPPFGNGANGAFATVQCPYTIPVNQPAGPLQFTVNVHAVPSLRHGALDLSANTSATVSPGYQPGFYYRGTDNKLHLKNGDGTTATFSNVSMSAAYIHPVPCGAYVYYVGADGTLSQCNHDGSDPVSLGADLGADLKPTSELCVTLGGIYFVSADNLLHKVYYDKTHKQAQIDPNFPTNISINSNPVAYGNYLYYRNSDNKIYRCDLNGSNVTWLGGAYSPNSPCVAANYIYYQGTNNRIYRMNLDGSNNTALYNNLATPYAVISGPVASGNYLFWVNAHYELLRTDLNGQNGLEGGVCSGLPSVGNGMVTWQGGNNNIIGLFNMNSDIYQMSANASSISSATCYSGAGYMSSEYDPTIQPTYNILHPKYQVFSLQYAPPGTSNAAPSAGPSVTYTVASERGVTTAASSTFDSSYSVGFAFAASDGMFDVSGSVDFTHSTSNTSEASQTVIKDASSGDSLSLAHPTQIQLSQGIPDLAGDGINHDNDRFFINVNPQIDVVTSKVDKTAIYAPTIDPAGDHSGNDSMVSCYITVGEIKTKTGVYSTLTDLGFTESDFNTILSLDPFANAAGVQPLMTTGGSNPPLGEGLFTTIDRNRFEYLTNFPYQPGSTANYAHNGQETWTTTDVKTNESMLSYNVSSSLNFGAGDSAVASASLTTSNSFTWANSTTHAVSNTTSYTAAYTACNASSSWPATTSYGTVYVYLDRVYRTLMFFLPIPSINTLSCPIHIVGGRRGTGSITLSAPAPEGGVRVTLTSTDSSTTVPAFIDIPAGATTGTFQITTQAVTQKTNVYIAASSGGGAQNVLLIVRRPQ